MPVVGISIERLGHLLRTPVPQDDLVKALERLGCDIEGFGIMRRFRCVRCGFVLEKTATEADPGYCDNCAADFSADPDLREELDSIDVIRLDLLAVRPDMFDVGGLARTLRAYLGHEPGLALYALAEPRLSVQVMPGLDEEESFRPAIACGVVRNLQFDHDLLKEIMRLQENLHWAMGRDRKRASIGIYDLAGISGQIIYRPVGPDELVFTPLGWESPVTPEQILKTHPKGCLFARLFNGFSRYPLLIDDAGQVLSMPPIINSEETKVTLDTREVFIDVTGPGSTLVNKTLNVMMTSILEIFVGSQGEAVTIRQPDDRCAQSPDLSPQEMTLDLDHARRLLGFHFSDEDAPALLGRMGHDAELIPGSRAAVRMPPYRADFLHERDLMEELAVAYGYDRIPRTMVPTMTVASELEGEGLADRVGRILTGLGFLEAMSLMLGNEEDHFSKFGLEVPAYTVLIANPISREQTLVRTWLLPGLLDILSRNTSRELPQSVFEVGNVTVADPDAETGTKDLKKVAMATIGSTAGFANVRSVMEAVVKELDEPFSVQPCVRPYYLEGRSAAVLGMDGEVRGEFGELHPLVLERFKLAYPIICGELLLPGQGWPPAQLMSAARISQTQ